MTPALRSRLEAERMFTVRDVLQAFQEGYDIGAFDEADGHLKAEARLETEQEHYLSVVQRHLSSDTTRIRPKRQA